MGALRELVSTGEVAPADARAALRADLRRLAVDRRVQLATDVEQINGESISWYDAHPRGTMLFLNWYDAPMPDRVIEADRRYLATRPLWGRTFELYNDPVALGPEAHRVYAQAGDTVRRSDLPFHAHVFDRDFAYVHLELDRAGRSYAYRVAQPELLADLRALFLQQWGASEPLLAPVPGGDPLEIVGQLVSGRTDEAAALRLGVSLRTYRRRVADLMDVLGTPSRFTAGVEADRRGLVALAEAVGSEPARSRAAS